MTLYTPAMYNIMEFLFQQEGLQTVAFFEMLSRHNILVCYNSKRILIRQFRFATNSDSQTDSDSDSRQQEKNEFRF